MYSESAQDSGSFLLTLFVVFVSSAVVAIPLFALGLGLPIVVFLPIALGVGALVASLSGWLMGRRLNAPGRRKGFLTILVKGQGTALLLILGIVLLMMSGVPVLPWIVPAVVSMAIIAYRVTAAALSMDR